MRCKHCKIVSLVEAGNPNEAAEKVSHRAQQPNEPLTVDEFAKFLDKTRTYVCNSIRAHLLPGQKIGGKFIIPVGSIALWEYRLSKTKEMESNY